MNIKKTSTFLLHFFYKRLAEIIGFLILISGIILFISLLSYSPEDPNFIFPENTEIKNIFGFHGSFLADLFLQSVGLIAYLISITLIISGINIIRIKELFLIIENIFFSILYSVFGTLFLTFFYSEAYTLYINGNGGFVGIYFNQSFLSSLIHFNQEVFFYLLILLIIFLLCAKAKGISTFNNIEELRQKESDRLKIASKFLRMIGIRVKEDFGRIKIYGNPNINLKKNYKVKNFLKDHRVFMMSSIAALTFGGNFKIYDKSSIKSSFPNFIEILKNLGARVI